MTKHPKSAVTGGDKAVPKGAFDPKTARAPGWAGLAKGGKGAGSPPLKPLRLPGKGRGG
jgi:hypothetical protein